MPEIKLGKSSCGQPMHYAVGAIIKRGDEYLLLDRKHIPYGFAGPAGHIEEGETPEQALKREVKEETGLEVLRTRKREGGIPPA